MLPRCFKFILDHSRRRSLPLLSQTFSETKQRPPIPWMSINLFAEDALSPGVIAAGQQRAAKELANGKIPVCGFVITRRVLGGDGLSEQVKGRFLISPRVRNFSGKCQIGNLQYVDGAGVSQ